MTKNVSVNYVRETVNQVLRTSKITKAERQAMMNMLEDILHKTGNYKGFKYLTAANVPLGIVPGDNWIPGVHFQDGNARFENTDSTRVEYF